MLSLRELTYTDALTCRTVTFNCFVCYFVNGDFFHLLAVSR